LIAKLAISTKNIITAYVLSRDFADYDTISANFDNCGSYRVSTLSRFDPFAA